MPTIDSGDTSPQGQEKAALGPARVVLFSRPGCHLCDTARTVVDTVTAELGERYVERDITLDPHDLRDYEESVPVVVVDGVQVDFWRISEDRLRAALGR